MKRLLLASVFAAAPFLALGPTAALAVSPSQEQCEAQGGEFTREQGTVMCVKTTEETPGNAPEFSNARRVKTTETTTGQGNISNKQEQETTCEGPPGQCK